MDSEEASLQTEKEQLVQEISSVLADVVTNMKTLNRNMDHLIEVGHELETVADVWAEFEDSMKASA